MRLIELFLNIDNNNMKYLLIFAKLN
jgi:hypothetical protein